MNFTIDRVPVELGDSVYRFAYHSWTRSGYEHYAHQHRLRKSDEHLVELAQALHAHQVKRLLLESCVTLATTEVDGDRMFVGWACHAEDEARTLHYCYVKAGFRRPSGLGLAKKLVGKPVAYSHTTHRNPGFMKWLRAQGAVMVGL